MIPSARELNHALRRLEAIDPVAAASAERVSVFASVIASQLAGSASEVLQARALALSEFGAFTINPTQQELVISAVQAARAAAFGGSVPVGCEAAVEAAKALVHPLQF